MSTGDIGTHLTFLQTINASGGEGNVSVRLRFNPTENTWHVCHEACSEQCNYKCISEGFRCCCSHLPQPTVRSARRSWSVYPVKPERVQPCSRCLETMHSELLDSASTHFSLLSATNT